MTTGALMAFVALLLGWSLVSGRLERLDVTGPIVFVAAGLVLCNGPWAVIDVSIESDAVHGLAEVTLALLLFADAARVDPDDLRHSRRPPDPAARHRPAADVRPRVRARGGAVHRHAVGARGAAREPRWPPPTRR